MIKAIGRFLDQPGLVNNFSKKVPPILLCGASGMVLYNTYRTPQNQRKEYLAQNGLAMLGAVSSSLLAPGIISKLFKTAPKIADIKKLNQANSLAVDNYLKTKKTNRATREALEGIKTRILNIKEIKTLSDNLTDKEGQILLKTLIPEPENITSKDIFSEIGRLSVFGLIPVLGGIIGGIIGDRLVSENYRENIPNKVKEGTYQYLANIFLCNVGAGAALYGLEKLNQKGIIKTLTPAKRLTAILSGITLTGIIGGSYIANFLSKKIINPLFKQKKESGIYSERKPEALDIALHSDDIATAGVLSGLKWVEPMLPVMYFLSGFRAGTGYRNVNN